MKRVATGVMAILGSTFDGSDEPVAEVSATLDAYAERTEIDVPIYVDERRPARGLTTDRSCSTVNRSCWSGSAAIY